MFIEHDTWRLGLRYGRQVGWKAQHHTIVIRCLDIAIYGYRWYRYIHTIHFCHTMVSHLRMFAPGFLWWLGCRVTTCTPQRFRLGHLSSSFGATVPEWGHTFTIAFQGTRWCWRSTQRMSHTWLWREAPGVSCPKTHLVLTEGLEFEGTSGPVQVAQPDNHNFNLDVVIV